MDLSELFEIPSLLPYKKLFKLFISWKEVVGNEYGTKSEPVGLKNGVLTIITDNEFVMTEMHFIKEEIKEVVNRWLGEKAVEEVRIRCHKKKEKQKEWIGIEKEPQIPPEIKKILESISDPSLKEKMERFVRTTLLIQAKKR